MDDKNIPAKSEIQRVRHAFLIKYGLYMGASSQLVGAIVLCLYLGHWADKHFLKSPLGLIFGLLFGVVAGFASFFKTLSQAKR